MPQELLERAAPSADQQQQAVAEQVRLLYRNGPAGIVVNLINAAIVGLLLWKVMPQRILLGWLVGVMVVAGWRVSLLLKYRWSKHCEADARRWGWLFCLGSAASGTTWGALGLLATIYLMLPYQVFVAFVVGGMMLGGLAVSGSMMAAYVAFMLPAGVPMAIGFVLRLEPMYFAMGAMALVFTLALYFLGRNINAAIVRAIRLLQELEATNRQLRAEVVERKRVEAALLVSEKRYALATSAGRVGIWDLNLKTNEIHLDPSLKAMLGYTDQEIANRLADWGALVHPDDRAQVTNKLQAHLQGLKPQYEVLHRMVHRDGSVRWFMARGTALRAANGEPFRLVGTDTDVTEWHLAEERARQRQAELAHVARLSSLGEMTTSLAHELNQPLGAISNYSQACLRTLRAEPTAPAVVLEALEQITAQARRAAQTVRRLRAFVRKSDGMRQPTDLNALVAEAVDFIERDAVEQGVRLRLQLASALPAVSVDAVQIQQVLLNLIRNAIEAMASITDNARVVTIVTERTSTRAVRLRVRDTGPGVERTAVTRVFDSFYTTKPQGMGMGLSISRSIVEAHDGRIWLVTPASGGAEFNFTLPLVCAYNVGQLEVEQL